MSYTKLFSHIVTSSIWSEDDQTRILWITMLALADKHGEVMASIPGLAKVAGLSIDATKVGLDKFLSPDPYSRTPDEEGRRIETIDGGWLIINYAKHRRMASLDEQREKAAERQRRFRKKEKANSNGQSRKVTDESRQSNGTVTLETDNAEAEAEADTEAEAKKKVLEAEEKLKALGHLGLWTEWKKIRKKKGGATTPTAEALILSRLLQHPGLIQRGLEKAITSSWIGFQWDWVDKSIKITTPKTSRPKPVGPTEEVGPMPGFKERMDKAKDRSYEPELEEVE